MVDRTSEPAETAGAVAELYLGNILYALERTALDLDGEGKHPDAAFYRGIGRKLAEAYGRQRGGPTGGTRDAP